MSPELLRQPRAVWAVAFACVVAFMGIGLVDPILPALAKDLHASPSQVPLLFTSYFAITGAAMLVTGFVSSRLGPKPTLLGGLALVVVFSALAGASGTVEQIAGFRAGWGLGNAMFIATALAVIVGAASGGVGGAIMLYEAALGLGIASGPLVGGFLGGLSWRFPFFGVAVLMSIAFIAIAVLLDRTPPPPRRVSLGEPLRALRHRALLVTGLVALAYNFGFFTLLAYSPFPLRLGEHALGAVFFGWGILLAVFSVAVAPALRRRVGTVASLAVAFALIAADLALMGVNVGSRTVLIAGVIAAGACIGIVNTVLTEAVMKVAPVERPVASAAYSFVRFGGGAIAPWVAGKLAEGVAPGAPFYLGAVAVAVAVALTVAFRADLRAADAGPAHAAVPGHEQAHGHAAARAARPAPAGATAS